MAAAIEGPSHRDVCSESGRFLEPRQSDGHTYKILTKTPLFGSFGQVFQAKDEAGKEVAIKVATRIDELAQNSFAREARFHEACKTDDVPLRVPLLDSGTVDLETGIRAPFFVFKWAGPDLLERIQDRTLSLREAQGLVFALLPHLVVMHELKWVHGDVKLENFTLSDDGSLGAIDLQAFRADEEGAVRGTIPYSDPCVALGLPASPEEDVWALGHLFYNLAMHCPIFYLREDCHFEQLIPSDHIFVLHQIAQMMGPELVPEEALEHTRHRELVHTVEGRIALEPISAFLLPMRYDEAMEKKFCDDPLKESSIDLLRSMFAPRGRRSSARALMAQIDVNTAIIERPLGSETDGSSSESPSAAGAPSP